MFGIIFLLHKPSVLELEMAGHSPSGFSVEVQNSWFHQLWQVVQVLKTITLPPPCFTVGMMFSMKCCVVFMSDVTGYTPSKKFNFCLISPQNICPKVLGIIKIFFGKSETSLCVIFGL